MLKTRILTALFLAVLVLSALFFLPATVWMLFCAVLISLAAWEWCALIGFNGRVSLFYPLATGASFIAIAWHPPAPELLFGFFAGASLFWLLVVPLWLIRKWHLRSAGYLNFLLGWAMLMPAGLALLTLRGNGWTLLAVLAIAWIADSAAYFVGRAIGRHKLAPNISPGKTWEGAAGGGIAVMVYCAFMPKPFDLSVVMHLGSTEFMQNSAWVGAGLIFAIVSIVGDLLESLFKRQAGMKDSSHLLPGHGGVLDRVDSLLALLPVVAAVYMGHFLFSAASAG